MEWTYKGLWARDLMTLRIRVLYYEDEKNEQTSGAAIGPKSSGPFHCFLNFLDKARNLALGKK